MSEATVRAVRDLHVQADWDDSYCAGCEPGLYAESGVEWPCATALLVYSAEEISAAVTARQERQDAVRAETHRES